MKELLLVCIGSFYESLYLVEGNDRAILIDAGTVIPGLDKIVAKITSKPVTMMLTHAHGDHAGGVGPFPEVYLNAGDMPLVPNSMRSYKGQIRYLFGRLILTCDHEFFHKLIV